MAVMAGFSISVSNTPYAWWYAVRDDLHNHLIGEGEVKCALNDLLSRASSMAGAPPRSAPCEDPNELWRELVVYLVGNWIKPGEVIGSLKQLRVKKRDPLCSSSTRNRYDGGQIRDSRKNSGHFGQKRRRNGVV